MSGDLDHIGYKFKWAIDFNSFGSFETKVKSPTIDFRSRNQMNTKWQLWMIRKNITSQYSEGYLIIGIENLNDFDIKAQVTMAFLNYENIVYKEYCLPNHLFTKSERCIPFEDLKISYWETSNDHNKILKNNKVTIECQINIDHCPKILPHTTNKKKFSRLIHFDMLEKLFMNQESSDIVIKAGEKEFYVHKNILETFSPVFEAMFRHDFLEKTKNKVEIVDFKPDVIEEFLRFIYTGKVNKIDEIENELLYAAEKYSVESLKLFCEEYLFEKISMENAIEYLELAVKCNAANLKKHAVIFINQHSKEMWKKKELRILGIDVVLEIMQNKAEDEANEE